MKAIVCVATQARFAQASVLRQSCEEHAPFYQFIDVTIEETPSESIYKTVSRTRIQTALALFDKGYEQVIHIGADHLIYDQLYFDGNLECVLFPHVVTALPSDINAAASMMRAGYINSDFQVWGNTSKVKDFFKTVLCFLDQGVAQSIFEYEQTWMPLAAATLNSYVCRDPGYEMAWYNLHERSLNSAGSVWEIGVKKASTLTTFHFSGFDVNTPGLSKHGQTRPLTPSEKDLLEDYRQKVLKCSR